VPRHHKFVKFSTLVEPKLQITRGFATRDLQFGHHSCGKFYTLVVPRLQIIRGFATHDLQFGHHAWVKTITNFSANWK
jgi:hypothetical protein